MRLRYCVFFFFQAEDGIRYRLVTGVQTCALPISPGSGKTTLALQFLLAGALAGESVLYVTLSETADELRAVAQSHGWSLDDVDIRELTPPEAALDLDEQNTLFHPSEVELAS